MRVIAGLLVATTVVVAGCHGGSTKPVPSPTATLVQSAPPTSTSPPAQSPSPSASTAFRGLKECKAAQLTVRSEQGQGATGHYFALFAFINRSTTACAMRGFPGVEYLDKQRQPMKATYHRGGGFGSFATHGTWIALNPGGRAKFQLEAEDFDSQSQRACPTSTYLGVYPPDDTTQLVVRASSPVCGDEVAISPVYASRYPPQG